MGSRLSKSKGFSLERAAQTDNCRQQNSIFFISYNNTNTTSGHQTYPKQLSGEVTVTNSEEKTRTAETCQTYITSPTDTTDDATYQNEVCEEVDTEDDPYDFIPPEFDRNDVYRRSTCTTQSSDSAFSDRSSVLTDECSYCKGHQSCGRKSPRNSHHRRQGNSGAVEWSTQRNSCYNPVDTRFNCGFHNEREMDIYVLMSEPERLIPYMVDTFRPLVEGSILVLDILPHLLTIIDDQDAIVQKDKLSHKEGARMLIQCIEKCQDVGKWQMFVDALMTAEYKYIARLLKGDTEEDQSINRRILKLFTPQIINRIDPKEFIDHLYEKEVIAELDKEEVEREHKNRGPIAASFMLLDRIPRRLSDWYDIFIDVLKKCKMEDMAKTLTVPEVTIIDNRKDTGSHDRPPLPPRDISVPRTKNITENNSPYNNLASKGSIVNQPCGTAAIVNCSQSCQQTKKCKCSSDNKEVYSSRTPNTKRTIDDVKQEHEEIDREIESLQFVIAEKELRQKKRTKERLRQKLEDLKEEDEEGYNEIPEEDEPYLFETIAGDDSPLVRKRGFEELSSFDQISDESMAVNIITNLETVSPVDSSVQDGAIKNSILERCSEQITEEIGTAPDTEQFKVQTFTSTDFKGNLIESDKQVDSDDYTFSEIDESRISYLDSNTSLNGDAVHDYDNSDEGDEIVVVDTHTIINGTKDIKDENHSTHTIHKALEKMTDTLKNHITEEIQKLSKSDTYSSNNYTNIEQMYYKDMPMPLYSLSHRRLTTPFGLAQGYLFKSMPDFSSMFTSLSCEIEEKL